MKVKTLVILEQAIEEGVRRGYSRAHKHVDNPTEGAIIEQIEDAVSYTHLTLPTICSV